MDRRQRKTREAIFSAFTQLLSQKPYNQITVGEIADCADVGRATFYSHFETKDFLLKAYCEELFCHLFDNENLEGHNHRHIFDCDSSDSVFLHMLRHIQKNDNNILVLLSSQNNELFLQYFKEELKKLMAKQLHLFENKRPGLLPYDYWLNHISASFVETVRWWIGNGMKESAVSMLLFRTRKKLKEHLQKEDIDL